jgi:hypothetical protein
MESGYLIVYRRHGHNDSEVALLLEHLRSNYVSKLGFDNTIIIFSSEGPPEIYAKAKKGVVGCPDLFVTRLDTFHGNLPTETWEWLMTRMAGVTWAPEPT